MRKPTRLVVRLAPVALLLVFAPVCAEYLSAYDNSVGRPAALIGGLMIFGPLYGAPALIIREVARRTGRGWPTMLLLAAAFGVIQAGLVDQSLFNPAYRDISYWEAMRTQTLIPGVGVSVDMLLNFVGGHVIWSMSAPIAVTESLVPARRTRPWLGPFGLTVVCLMYVTASWFVLKDSLATEGAVASPLQLAGAGAAAAALIVTAFVLGRRTERVGGRTPRPWLVAVLATAGAIVLDVHPADWVGVSVVVAVMVAAVVMVTRWSRRAGWGPAHVLAVAAGPLLSRTVTGFLSDPIGDASVLRHMLHSSVLAVLVLVLLIAAARAVGRAARPGYDGSTADHGGPAPVGSNR